MLRNSVSIKALPILKASRAEWRNSMPRFGSLPEQGKLIKFELIIIFIIIFFSNITKKLIFEMYLHILV